MTSEQVRLILLSVLALASMAGLGCTHRRHVQAPLVSPYAERQVWAVAPLRNESGSLNADGLRLADHLTHQLELVQGIDTLPVNRVINAMQALEMNGVRSPEDALALRNLLGVDGLVVGSITAYDPYDPMVLGLALDFYAHAVVNSRPLDIRALSWAPTSDAAGMNQQTVFDTDQPNISVAGYFSASSPDVKRRLEAYAYGRGTSSNARHNTRLYTLDTNLFGEFVSYQMCSHLVWAQWQQAARQHRQEAAQQAAVIQETSPR